MTEARSSPNVSKQVQLRLNSLFNAAPSRKIKDLSAFKKFAIAYGHLTAQKMAELWPEPISDVTIGKALKRIGFTRKSGAIPRRFVALGNAHQEKDLWVPRET